MDVSALSLRDLRAVVAVARYGNFGLAAKSVFVTQPALSSQIKKIETVLQVQIFERSQRGVIITPIGKILIGRIREILMLTDELAIAAQVQDKPLCDKFRLGAIATLGPYLFAKILAPIKRQFPMLDLIVSEGLTDSLLEQLKKGDLDAVLAAPTFSDAGLSTQNLFFEPFVALLSRDDELAQKKRLRLADIDNSKLLLLEEGHCLKDQVLAFCARRGPVVPSYQATSLETLRSMVASGMGMTLLPALAVGYANTHRLTCVRPFGEAGVGRQVILVTRKAQSDNPSVAALADFIKQLKLVTNL